MTIAGRIGLDMRHELEDSIAARTSGVRVYVAGASAEIGRARLCMAEIERLLGPGSVVYDWLRPVEDNQRIGCLERDMSKPRRSYQATQCSAGVEAADVFWLLVPAGPSFGAPWEFGYACGRRSTASVRGQLLVLSGPEVRRSIFTEFADELHELDSAARDSITRFAAHRARAVGG